MSEPDRLKRILDLSSPQFIEDTISTIARARGHLAKGRIAVAAELLRATEDRLGAYDKAIRLGRR